MIELYVKCSGKHCARCEAAENKLKRLDVDYVKFCIEDRLMNLHDHWRDGSVERSAGWDMLSRPVPYIWITETERGFDYPGAMRFLRTTKREVSCG
jgi:glutaredoxin